MGCKEVISSKALFFAVERNVGELEPRVETPDICCYHVNIEICLETQKSEFLAIDCEYIHQLSLVNVE